MKSLIEQLKIDEGFSKMPYLCPAGKLSIGYGYNLEANSLHISDAVIKAWKANGIYEHEAAHILERMVNDCIMSCENNFVWWSKLAKVRQHAVINMVYNLGMSRFLGFKLMLRCLECGDWVTASANALDSKWAKQVGDRAQRIAKAIRDGK